MKKLWLVLCMVTCILGMTACDSKKEIEISPEYAGLQPAMESLQSAIVGMSAGELQANNPALAEAWASIDEDLGAYVGTIDFTVDEGHGTITAVLTSEFEDRDIIMTYVFNESAQTEEFVFEKVLHMGEILQKAGLNTILGMGTVFSVLIFISILISCFKYIPKLQEKFSKKKEDAVIAEKAVERVVEQITQKEENLADDLELVAVISAAIAAAEGTSPEGFVVRTIRRSKTNKWNRA